MPEGPPVEYDLGAVVSTDGPAVEVDIPAIVVAPPVPEPGPPAAGDRPVVPLVTEHLYRELKVTQPGDDKRSWPLLKTLGAVGVMFGRLGEIIFDTDDRPGWTILLDPARCPGWALRWLSQFAGVRAKVEGAATDDERRRLIISPPPFERGGPQAMTQAVQATLTGSRQVRIVENVNGDARLMTVITRVSETLDPTVTEAAARSQKPIGLLLTYQTSDAPTIDEGTRVIDSATAVIDTATLADIT